MNKPAICTAIHQQDLKSLLEHRGKPALSIYIPASDLSDVSQRFREARAAAEAELDEYALNATEIRALLAPLQQLAEDPDFCQQATQGMALYLSAEKVWPYFQAVTPDLRVVADDYFYVIPLITHYLTHRTFYVINLNDPKPRLYVASQLDITEIPLYAPALQNTGAIRQLALELQDFLQVRLSPLLIICRDELRYHQLHDLLSASGLSVECHHCQADTPSLQGLHQQVWDQIAPLLRLEQEEALRDYQTLQNSSKILRDVVSVVQAAYNSRVDKLFLVKRPSAYSHRSQRVDDLLNQATIYTYLNGGEVYTVEPDVLSGAEQAAAILRY